MRRVHLMSALSSRCLDSKQVLQDYLAGHFSMNDAGTICYLYGKTHIIHKYRFQTIFIILYVLPYVMAQEETADSSCILRALALESAISPRISSSFQYNMVFRNQDLSAECSHCYQCVLASGPFHCMYVYVHSQACMFLYV